MREVRIAGRGLLGHHALHLGAIVGVEGVALDVGGLDALATKVPGAFVLVQEGTTKAVAETRPEAHRNFIDIQILTAGRERFGLAHAVPGLQPVEDRYADRDIAFYPTPDREFFVEFGPGDYGVFFPGELHRPFLSPRDDASGQIRKLVVKVPASALTVA
jgi:biofilm protein TabA